MILKDYSILLLLQKHIYIFLSVTFFENNFEFM